MINYSFLPRLEVLASRVDRFLPMFTRLVAKGIDEKSIKGTLKSLSRVFVKEPHFVWAVKQYRGYLQDRLGIENQQTKINSDNYRYLSTRLPEFGHFFKNALADNFRPILDFKLTEKDTAQSFMDKLQKLEKENSDKKTDQAEHRVVEVDPATEKTFLKFSDKWEWRFLDRSYCEKEKKAMDHCGNADYKSGDKLLSLREPVGKDLQRPHLTFILNDGVLGETKGYSNNKPSAKFHKYIVPLLKDDRIESIMGGGYKPKNNFHLSDLGEEKAKQLLQEKPSLDFPTFLAAGNNADRFLEHGESLSSDGKYLIVEKFSDIDEFCKYFKLQRVDRDFEVYEYHGGDVDDWLVAIAEQSPKEFWKIYHQRLKDYDNREDIIERDFNPETEKIKEAADILIYFLDEDEEIKSAVRRAWMSATEVSIRDAVTENYMKWLKDEAEGEDDYRNKYSLIWDGTFDSPVEVATDLATIKNKRGRIHFDEPRDHLWDLWHNRASLDDNVLAEIFFDEL